MRPRPILPLLVPLAWLCACANDTAGPGERFRFSMVSAGREHACAVSLTGQVYCWGDNAFGQLGLGSTEGSPLPIQVPSGQRFSMITAGFLDTCALTVAGTAWCWGSNVNGQVGDGTEEQRNAPVLVAGPVRFVSITTGEAHTCGIDTRGLGYCWGAPLGPYVAGEGRPPNLLRPTTLGIGGLLSVSAGYEIACAVGRSGDTYCWGRIAPGVPADGTDGTATSGLPVRIFSTPPLQSVSAGHKHACGTGEGGQVYCWGRNSAGQLGDGTFEDRLEPRPVSGAAVLADVAAHGPSHSCGLTAEGLAFCWGSNAFGQLGDGTTTLRTAPTAVAGDLRFRQVSVGFAHTCGVTVDDLVYCWGAGGSGQLGTGDFADASTPQRIGGSG